MPTLRRFYRILRITLHVVYGYFLLLLFVGANPDQRSARDWRIINHWMRGICQILGLRIHVHGEAVTGPALFVCNHISWHDIVVLQSIMPTGFIAKHEIRHWPIIGWMAYRGNTLFIKRGTRNAIHAITHAMSKRFRAQQSMLLFPEGTTSTGESILPFRSRLYVPAIETQTPIQTLGIYYDSDNSNCKELAYVEDATLIAHAWRLMAIPNIDVYVHFHPEVTATNKQDRRELGKLTHAQVTTLLTPYLP